LIIAVVGGWRGYPILIAFYFVGLTLALVDLTLALPKGEGVISDQKILKNIIFLYNQPQFGA
jgi:hypothetical protein